MNFGEFWPKKYILVKLSQGRERVARLFGLTPNSFVSIPSSQFLRPNSFRFDQMDVPDPKYLKLSNGQTRQVQDFLRAYIQDLQPGDKSSCDPIFSAVQKKFPELRLARSTFFRKFGRILEALKQDAGLPIRSKVLDKEYIARARETFLKVLSDVPLEKFKSIIFSELVKLANANNPSLELTQRNLSTLQNHFSLHDLKKEAGLRRPHQTPAPIPEAHAPAPGGLENDPNEGPCLAASRGSEPSAAGAARGGAAVGAGDVFTFTGEYDNIPAFRRMRLDEIASVDAPPEPGSESYVNVAATDVDGAEGDGRPEEAAAARASIGAGAAARTSDGTGAVARELATEEEAEARELDEEEGRGGDMNGNASRTAFDPMDNGTTAGHDHVGGGRERRGGDAGDESGEEGNGENQRDSGDLTAFAK